MPQFCIVVGCGSRSKRDNLSFYSVPTALHFKHKQHMNQLSQLRRERWLAAINRQDLSKLKVKNERVCSKHFITGKPAHLEDVEHPDWIPTQNMGHIHTIKKKVEKKVPRRINSHVECLVPGNRSSKIKENRVLNLVTDFMKATFEHDTDDLSKRPPVNLNNIIIVSNDPPDWSVKEKPEEIQLDEHPVHKTGTSFLPQLMNPGVLKCRTCLSIIDSSKSYSVSTECGQPYSTKTVKDMITFCIPQMAQTLSDYDLVCSKCLESIKFCEQFVTNCLEIEAKLQDVYDVQNSRKPSYGVKPEYEISVNNKTSDKLDHVSLDHSYTTKNETHVEKITSTEPSENPKDIPTVQMVTEDLSKDNKQLVALNSVTFLCPICAGVFKTCVQLKAHLKEVHNHLTNTSVKKSKSKYKCIFCEKTFTTISVCKVHIERNHQDMNMKRKIYFCKECKLECGTLSDLLEHKLIHGFKCTICSKSYSSKKKLIAHKQTHPDEYFCDTCGKGFKSKDDLRIHSYRHREQQIAYICDKCGHTCKSKETLQYHINTHKTENRYMCDKCSKMFIKKSALLLHQKVVHEKIRDYECTECKRKFGTKMSLNNHFAVKHSISKPYQCELCGSRFGRKDYLQKHKNCLSRKLRVKRREQNSVKEGSANSDHKMHRHIARLKCTFCNLTFTSFKNRDRHEQIHEESSYKYRCQICSLNIKTKEDLDEHILTHLNSDMYKCHICGELVSSQNLLNTHITENHMENNDNDKENDTVYMDVASNVAVERSI